MYFYMQINTFKNEGSIIKKKNQNTAGLSANSLGYRSQVAPYSLPL